MRRLRFEVGAGDDPRYETEALELLQGKGTHRLALAGDTLLSARIPIGALSCIAPLAKQSLVFAVNLEGTCTDNPRPPFLFASPVSRAAELASAGITLASVANNHSRDHGASGLVSTIAALDTHGIQALGLGPGLVLTTSHGLRIGWLAAGRTGQDQIDPPHFRELDAATLVDDARAHRASVDVLICSLHLGYMYVDYPHPDHRALTHALIDAGADLVVCHHAHVLQGFERRGRGLIAHNLGNLLVDPEEGVIASAVEPELQREGGLLLVDVDRTGLCGASFVPTLIDENLRLAWPDVARADKILSRLEKISADLAGDYLPMFERQRAERNADLGLAELGALLRGRRWRELARMLRRGRLEHLRMLWRRMVGRRVAD